LPGECHGDYPPRLCHTPFTRIWPHEELCRFSALDHCSAPFSRACWLALAPPTLLGRGSRHCHGINCTHDQVLSVMRAGYRSLHRLTVKETAFESLPLQLVMVPIPIAPENLVMFVSGGLNTTTNTIPG